MAVPCRVPTGRDGGFVPSRPASGSSTVPRAGLVPRRAWSAARSSTTTVIGSRRPPGLPQPAVRARAASRTRAVGQAAPAEEALLAGDASQGNPVAVRALVPTFVGISDAVARELDPTTRSGRSFRGRRVPPVLMALADASVSTRRRSSLHIDQPCRREPRTTARRAGRRVLPAEAGARTGSARTSNETVELPQTFVRRGRATTASELRSGGKRSAGRRCDADELRDGGRQRLRLLTGRRSDCDPELQRRLPAREQGPETNAPACTRVTSDSGGGRQCRHETAGAVSSGRAKRPACVGRSFASLG